MSRVNPSPPPSPCLRASVVVCLLPVAVAIVTVVVFARLVGCQFTVWDDAGTIWQNRRLNPPTLAAVGYYWATVGRDTPGQLYTPVTYTVWAAMAAVSDAVVGRTPDADGGRLSPAVFHAANVLLHGLTAALAYGLLRRLSGRPWAAAAGALVFALHPVQVEPVGWASGTKDVLCGLFSVAALWAYLSALPAVPAKCGEVLPPSGPAGTGPSDTLSDAAAPPVVGRTRRRLLYLAATVLFLLAMLSKPTALVVPLMAVTIDVLLVGRPWRTAAAWLWPWALLMLPCVLWTRAAQPAPWASPIPVWDRPLVSADAVAFYLCKVAWPAHLCVDYGRRPTAVVASGVVYYSWLLPVAVLAAVAWRGGRRGVAVAGLFVLPLLPVLGLVPFDFQFYSTVADHYLYLPMVGVGAAAAWAVARLPRRAGAVASAVVLSTLAVRSVAQEPTWHDTASLFAHVLAVNPDSFVANNMMGYTEGQAAIRLRGDRPRVPATDPDYGRWRAHLERSLAWYDRSLARNPEYVPSLLNLSINYDQLDRPADRRAALRRMASLQPSLPAAMRADPPALGELLIEAGDPAGAAAYLDGVLRADPSDAAAAAVRRRALAAGPRGTDWGFPGGGPGPHNGK